MKLALAILATMMWLTSNHPGESESEREARLWQLAVPLAVHSRDPREASFAITQGWAESRLARGVHFGACKPGQCDPNSHGIPRAAGPWQHHNITGKPGWSELWRDAHSLAGSEAAVRLQLAMQREAFSCRGNLAESYSAHDGRGCRRTMRGEFRERKRRTVEAYLRRELEAAK